MSCPNELHPYEHCAHDAGRYWVMPKVEAFLAKHLRPATTRSMPNRRLDKGGREVCNGRKPTNFNEYWDALDQELARYEATPVS